MEDNLQNIDVKIHWGIFWQNDIIKKSFCSKYKVICNKYDII